MYLLKTCIFVVCFSLVFTASVFALAPASQMPVIRQTMFIPKPLVTELQKGNYSSKIRAIENIETVYGKKSNQFFELMFILANEFKKAIKDPSIQDTNKIFFLNKVLELLIETSFSTLDFELRDLCLNAITDVFVVGHDVEFQGLVFSMLSRKPKGILSSFLFKKLDLIQPRWVMPLTRDFFPGFFNEVRKPVMTGQMSVQEKINKLGLFMSKGGKDAALCLLHNFMLFSFDELKNLFRNFDKKVLADAIFQFLENKKDEQNQITFREALIDYLGDIYDANKTDVELIIKISSKLQDLNSASMEVAKQRILNKISSSNPILVGDLRASIKTVNFVGHHEVTRFASFQELMECSTEIEFPMENYLIRKANPDVKMDSIMQHYSLGAQKIILVDNDFYTKIEQGQLSRATYVFWLFHEIGHFEVESETPVVEALKAFYNHEIVGKVKAELPDGGKLETRLGNIFMTTDSVLEEALASLLALQQMKVEDLDVLIRDFDIILNQEPYVSIREMLARNGQAEKLQILKDMFVRIKGFAGTNRDFFKQISLESVMARESISQQLFREIAEDKLIYYWA